MYGATRTWGEMTPGYYVADQNGKTWHIDGITQQGQVTLRDAAGETVQMQRPRFDREVYVFEPTPEEMRAFIDGLVATFGGTIIQDVAT